MRCEAHGHSVRVFLGPLKTGECSTIGDGILTKVKDWEPSMKWADIVLVSDNVKYLSALEKYRKRGFPIFGPSVELAEWELDRDVGQKVMEIAGIETIPSTEFSNYDKAIAFVEANLDKRYVSKPSGDADKALSYVSKGPADMLYMLQYWKKHQKVKSPFILQEFEAGIEMAVGGWFGQGGFSQYYLENFEFKKLMNGEVGVNTGEMGTAMKYCTLEESKLAQEVLSPLVPMLHRCGYTGFIDVSVIISKKTGKPCPMEFTCRPGWPLFQIQQVLHEEPVEWMHDLLFGRDTFKPLSGIALGVVVAIPKFPYPVQTQKELSGYPVWGISEKNRYNIHPAEMMLGSAPEVVDGKVVETPMLVSSGNYVLVCSGTGKTVSAAKAKAYSVLKELEIPNSPMYRTDIGGRLEMQLPKLQAQGYAMSWEF